MGGSFTISVKTMRTNYWVTADRYSPMNTSARLPRRQRPAEAPVQEEDKYGLLDSRFEGLEEVMERLGAAGEPEPDTVADIDERTPEASRAFAEDQMMKILLEKRKSSMALERKLGRLFKQLGRVKRQAELLREEWQRWTPAAQQELEEESRTLKNAISRTQGDLDEINGVQEMMRMCRMYEHNAHAHEF
jgi:hypothetical protein